MMCYRDMTFCSNDKECATQDCSRRLTEKDYEYLKANDFMPVSVANFREGCSKFKEISNG